MSYDIVLAISGNPIKNGTAIASCSFAGEYQTLNTSVYNKPIIEDIQNKYDERFDDITYYTIGSGTVS